MWHIVSSAITSSHIADHVVGGDGPPRDIGEVVQDGITVSGAFGRPEKLWEPMSAVGTSSVCIPLALFVSCMLASKIFPVRVAGIQADTMGEIGRHIVLS